jgi:putative intracellular protease/amidase
MVAGTTDKPQQVLIIVTSHGQMGASGERTGVWLEELAVPYMTLIDAGVQVQVVSILGGELPIDPRSIKPPGENPPLVERFLDNSEARRVLNFSPALAEIDWEAFDAVFFPGGHGTMWDYPDNPLVERLVVTFLAAAKPVAAVCHGLAALVSAHEADGKPLVAGHIVSGFTDSEEHAAGFTDIVPFSLETRLRDLGATVKSAADFEPFAVRDGCLITGQNPASSQQVAQLLLEALGL